MTDSSRKLPVSVVIPVKNEAENLRSMLPLLKRFAQVLVVDSSSDDETEIVAKSHGCECIDFQWNGCYPKKRNWTLDQSLVKSDWVLFLDADELVNERFIDEIASSLEDTDCVGFWLAYTNIFVDKPLKFGVPERKLALFRVDSGRYEKIEENHWSDFDMEIHEHPVLNGKIGKLNTKILHKEYKNIEKYIFKHVEYAKWEAYRYSKLKQAVDSGELNLTGRQKIKYSLINKSWFPFLYFTYAFFLRLGFLDGVRGLQYAWYKGFYFSTIGIMIREK